MAEALARHGARAFRLNTDRFPLKLKLTGRFQSAGSRFEVQDGHDSLRSEEVSAVWLRRLARPELSDELDPTFREVCASESTAAIFGLLDALHGARWIDPLPRVRESESKLRQLRLAQREGLQVPATLITNDPAEAEEFFKQHRGATVAKLIHHPPEGLARSRQFIRTSEVKATDFEDSTAFRHSPALFQERIAKRSDLRAIFVDGQFFVAAIDSRDLPEAQLDWRRADPSECKWTKDNLPDDVARKLTGLMLALGLSYGAIDLIRTPDNRHVFLEVNSGGEWGMLERDLGYPISTAIAGALVR
ncbi:MAG TPA: MvdC family ATP-grasp ribosomal peptide maturase [Myxococcaceae bacterium]|nr:MvdC family ATP-grasp ribosomal peptide maturase [Myxococcaceae bacterium]